MKNIVYIVSDIDKALAFEWVALRLKSKFKLSFILIGKKKSYLADFLNHQGITYHEIDDISYPSMLRKWWTLFFLLKRNKPDYVHTHLWRANLLGLTTSWALRISRRIYTRHHATIHYREYPSGRKWDRLCNALATDIIAISGSIKEILIDWDKADASKITIIPHGFDFEYFEQVDENKTRELMTKYRIEKSTHPVIGVISRYVEWKGVQFVVPAFKKILTQYPTAKLILANAIGEFEEVLKEQLRELPRDSYVEIEFEKDLAALYRIFNVYIHVPIDPYAEAFGQTYIESLIAGVPSVFTLSGIAREFIRHRENAWVVDFQNSDQIEEAIRSIIDNAHLRADLITNGKTSIRQFSLDTYILRLEELYNAR